MQKQHPERRFTENPSQQPVYRFPQNQQANGWQPQPGFNAPTPKDESPVLSRRDRQDLKRAHRHKRRRIFTLWNLFAVVGIITTIIQAARYIIIPALVYLNVITGGGQ